MKHSVVRKKRRAWRGRTYLLVLAAIALVSALLYWEQAAVLYVVSSVLICVLLLVVAFADLENREQQLQEQRETDRGAAVDSQRHDSAA